jgi:Ca-activated chloride channel family protein
MTQLNHWAAFCVPGIIALGSLSLLSCGSDSEGIISPSTPVIPDPERSLTFSGAITESFLGDRGVMEFNLTVLTQKDPIQPLINVAAGDLSFTVTRVTNLQGIPQPIEITLSPTQVINPPSSLVAEPLHLSLLMDGSGSLFVTDQQDLRFEAAFGLVEQYRSNPLDLGAILRFDNQDTGFGSTALGRPLQTAQLLQDFTADRFDLERGILGATAGGDTALFDATVEAGQLLSDFSQEDGINRRLVVFTDGIDNDSDLSLNEAIAELQSLPNGSATGLPVYIIGLGTALELFDLQQLARSTEGTFVLALLPQQLDTAFANLFPAAVGEQRVEVSVGSTSPLPAGEYLLDGQITLSQSGEQITTNFVDAALIVP